MRQALAATTMAVAAAGGGLLIAAAGAVPAYAAAPAAPAAPGGGHTVTITAHPAAGAANGIGPQATLPCATKGASCLPPTIECVITANQPFVSAGLVTAIATVRCTSSVPEINLQQALLQSGVPVGGSGDVEQNSRDATGLVDFACQSGTYVSTAEAAVTLPPGTS